MSSDQILYDQLIEAVRGGLHGKKISIPMSSELLCLAQRHQVQNLVYIATGAQEIEGIFDQSAAQSMLQQYAADQLMDSFEEHGLKILPIKGICTKSRYPDPILRTMGDLDVLCDMSESKEVHLLMKELGFSNFKEGRVHNRYTQLPYMPVEIHKTLVDGDSEYYEYYKNILQRCRPREGRKYIYEMSLEDEYIFNIIHLAGHFKNGGIGVRFVVDVYVYEHIEMYHGLKMERAYLETELKNLGLLVFYDNLRNLAMRWFGTDEERSQVAPAYTVTIQRLERYVLSNGLFGKKINQTNVNAAKGKISTLLHACFPGYGSMKSMFPWLKPALLPYGWILRGIKAVKHRRGNIRAAWDTSITGDRDEGMKLIRFFEECGLKI